MGCPPKNRYEHVHVRLFPAILGLQHFWEGSPQAPFSTTDIAKKIDPFTSGSLADITQ